MPEPTQTYMPAEHQVSPFTPSPKPAVPDTKAPWESPEYEEIKELEIDIPHL